MGVDEAVESTLKNELSHTYHIYHIAVPTTAALCLLACWGLGGVGIKVKLPLLSTSVLLPYSLEHKHEQSPNIGTSNPSHLLN